jgi:hypothetical protein
VTWEQTLSSMVKKPVTNRLSDSTASSYLESVKTFSYGIHYLLRLELFIICTK